MRWASTSRAAACKRSSSGGTSVTAPSAAASAASRSSGVAPYPAGCLRWMTCPSSKRRRVGAARSCVSDRVTRFWRAATPPGSSAARSALASTTATGKVAPRFADRAGGLAALGGVASPARGLQPARGLLRHELRVGAVERGARELVGPDAGAAQALQLVLVLAELDDLAHAQVYTMLYT